MARENKAQHDFLKELGSDGASKRVLHVFIDLFASFTDGVIKLSNERSCEFGEVLRVHITAS